MSSRRDKKQNKKQSSQTVSLDYPEQFRILQTILSSKPDLTQMMPDLLRDTIRLSQPLPKGRSNNPTNGLIHPPAKARTKPEMSPEDIDTMLSGAANSCSRAHAASLRKQPGTRSSKITITKFEPLSLVEGQVIVNSGSQNNVRFEYDHDEMSFSVYCTCGKYLCIHSLHLMEEIENQLTETDSLLTRRIYGDDVIEQVKKSEEERRQREIQARQTQVLSVLQRSAKSLPSLNVGLDQTAVADAERIVWNLKAKLTAGTTRIELKPVRQKEKKTGGWTKGRECALKSFMEMPRSEWSEVDWAIAQRVEHLSWPPYYRVSDGSALDVLAGTDSFLLNHEPASLELHGFELVVEDTGDGGWALTTSASFLRKQWNAQDHTVVAYSPDGALVINTVQAKAAWISTPPQMRDLARLLQSEAPLFAANQRELLTSQLAVMPDHIPVRLPESLGGTEIQEFTETVLLLRLKGTGVLDATVCIRDSRQVLILPGEGFMRRNGTMDDLAVQFIRDANVERQNASAVVSDLSLKRFRFIKDWSWQITDPDDVVSLLSEAGKLVTEERLKIVWHKASAKEFNIIGSVSAANVSVKVSRQRDWFGVDGTCHIGNQEVPLKSLLAGLKGTASMAGFIELSPGQWAAIADEFRATLQRLADVSNDNRGKLQIDQSAAMVLSSIEEKALNINADKAWKSCLKKVRSIKTITPEPPAALNCSLRDYQVEGFQWMCRLSEWGVGGILADDMGLGKTVQTLAILLQRIETGPLVIAPTSLGFNWEQECTRFAPSLTARQLRESDREDLIRNASEGDVIICSYGLALRETELLQSISWGTLVLDEAQNIKNSNAKTAKEIRKLKAGWKVALTGTPMENHLGELWSIFRSVSPGILGAWEQFRKKFATPIEKDNNNERRVALSGLISPFILRRSKSEVLKDLPERSEANLLIELTPRERERYDQVRLAAIGELDSLGDTELSTDQRFKVLQLLTKLRQIACHVGLVDDKWKDGSSKLSMLMEQLEQLKERGHRPLIFSQFTSHLRLIREACDAVGITYQYLDGQTTPKGRQQRVEAFQNGESDAFLISLKAGGTGLNLTAADYVIHMDPWWNPAVEDQATDRAHRIGQKNKVMVYRIIAKDTIEEQILSLHGEKRDLVEGVLSGAEASAKLSTEELASLIRDGLSARTVAK